VKPAATTLLIALAAAAPAEPSGYHGTPYESPVPRTLRGAHVLSTAQAHALWQSRRAVFVDVLPRPPKPAGLPATTIWHDKIRLDIPGSTWLPDTGYDALAPATQTYLEHGLAAATAGDHTKPLVFYCKPDCWMSWNAAKRALSLGYTSVDWYPDGATGWAAANLPLERRDPQPRDGKP
jgi:PQQ-dependent catabolism-associated CXXCW motif protein